MSEYFLDVRGALPADPLPVPHMGPFFYPPSQAPENARKPPTHPGALGVWGVFCRSATEDKKLTHMAPLLAMPQGHSKNIRNIQNQCNNDGYVQIGTCRNIFWMSLGHCQRTPSRAPIWVHFFILRRRRQKTAENLRRTATHRVANQEFRIHGRNRDSGLATLWTHRRATVLKSRRVRMV